MPILSKIPQTDYRILVAHRNRRPQAQLYGFTLQQEIPLGQGESKKPGKFWVYERIIRIPYYGIYEVNSGRLEVCQLVGGLYQALVPNQRGHYPIVPLGIEPIWYLYILRYDYPKCWLSSTNLLLSALT